MARTHGSWTGGTLTARSLLKPQDVARAVFHPAWIPQPLDPSVERLKRARVIAGAITSLGVYTFVEGGFDLTELLENAMTASVVLLFLTPLTVGAMLLVWRRGGTVRQLRTPLLKSLALLVLFVGCVAAVLLLVRTVNASANVAVIIGFGMTMLWLLAFTASGAVRVSGNFFGTAAVHRCLPPLLAMVTSWLVAVPDLVTGDLHGLSLTLGIVFILGAPVTVTAIALLEMRRLKRRYGIRLNAHPATHPPVPGPVPPMPPAGSPYLPPQGNPYGPPHAPSGQHPYAPHPYAPHPQPPYNPRSPYGG
ncbi:proline-rich domain-containing protein [Streptomyces tuirus]|uniref:proline-rich domain-containing protein n=1 Tax=Streptomyces tuirus TaxID=68278 RepID=UPI003446C293